MTERIALLISYDINSKKFNSCYERNKFYRGLFGFKQTIKKKNKTYCYTRQGLLSKIPHIRVEDSVFIIAEKYFEEMEKYFNAWGDKVSFNIFKVLLEEYKWKNLLGD